MPEHNLEHVVYGLRRFLTGRVKEKTELPRLSQDHAIRSSLVVHRYGNHGHVEHFYVTDVSRRDSLTGKVFYVDVHTFDGERVGASLPFAEVLAIVAQNYRDDVRFFESQHCGVQSFKFIDRGQPPSVQEFCQEVFLSVLDCTMQ